MIARLLLLAAAAPVEAPVPIKTVSAAELGSVLATLDDWRVMILVAYAFVAVLLVFLGVALGFVFKLATSRSANDQATLDALLEGAKASAELAASVRALEVIASRRESERAP